MTDLVFPTFCSLFLQYLDLYPNVTIYGRKAYNAMATTMDDASGNITRALKANGMWDNTLYVARNKEARCNER